jgi:hypothetical protein
MKIEKNEKRRWKNFTSKKTSFDTFESFLSRTLKFVNEIFSGILAITFRIDANVDSVEFGLGTSKFELNNFVKVFFR